MKRIFGVAVAFVCSTVINVNAYAQTAKGKFTFDCVGVQTAQGSGTLYSSPGSNSLDGFTHVNDAPDSQARGLSLRLSVKNGPRGVHVCNAYFGATDPTDPNYKKVIGYTGDPDQYNGGTCPISVPEGGRIWVGAGSGSNQAMPSFAISEACTFRVFFTKPKGLPERQVVK